MNFFHFKNDDGDIWLFQIILMIPDMKYYIWLNLLFIDRAVDR